MKKEYTGLLFGWIETGLEGAVWALQRDDLPGYEGLVMFEPKDYLKIFSPEKQCLFSGTIIPDYEAGKTPRLGTSVVQPAAMGFWIHWTQKGFKPNDWATLFLSEENTRVLVRDLNPLRIPIAYY